MERGKAREFWNRITESRGEGADPSALGTVTSDTDIVRLRDELEQRHVARLIDISPATRVLDIGGGAGRFAIPLAQRAAHVTLVDISEALLARAERRARELGLSNLTFVASAAQDFEPQGPYDLITVMNLCTYLTDEELERFAERLARSLAPRGKLLVKEPVTTDGVLRFDHGSDPASGYLARFRPREEYARVFSKHLQLTYQRATLSHPIPWFLGGTNEAVGRTRSPARATLLRLVSPAFVRLDPLLLSVETRVRQTPGLRRVLAPIPVLNDLYVLTKMARP